SCHQIFQSFTNLLLQVLPTNWPFLNRPAFIERSSLIMRGEVYIVELWSSLPSPMTYLISPSIPEDIFTSTLPLYLAVVGWSVCHRFSSGIENSPTKSTLRGECSK